jgi:ABC-type transport system involved in multi-copper enzyme maturation permease subunit
MVYLFGGILTVVAPQVFVVAGLILSAIGLPFSASEFTSLSAPQIALVILPFDVPGLSGFFKWIYVAESVLLGLGFLALSGRSLKPLDVKRTLSLAKIRRRRLKRASLHPPPPHVRKPRTPPARKPRRKSSRYRGRVWDNPVAWKEVVTDQGALVTILVVCGVALLAYLSLTALFLALTVVENAGHIGFILQDGLVMGELLIIGLMAVTYAGTAMGKENAGGLMEILAATPLSAIDVFTGKFTGFMRTLVPLWIFFGIHTLAVLLLALFFTSPVVALKTFLFPLYVLLFAVTCGSACLFFSLFGRTQSVGMIGSLVLLLAWWIAPPVMLSLVNMDGATFAWGCNPFFGTAALNALVWPEIEGLRHGSVYGPEGPATPVTASFVFLAGTAFVSIWAFSALYDRRMGRS